MSADERHSVERHLRVDAEGYDVQIRRFIPYYDDMIATGVELLAALAPADGHVLDLGGGTGALSSAVLGGASGRPRDRARRRPGDAWRGPTPAGGFGDRVSFREGSFLDPLPPPTPSWPRWRCTTSTTCGRRRALSRDSRRRSPRRGPLLNLDAAVTEDSRLNRLVFDRMAARMGDHGIGDAEARAPFAAWAGEDRYFPLEAEMDALREAGFDEVECFWRRGLSSIICAVSIAP